MDNTIKWDGTSPLDHEPIVKIALLSYITDEEKQTAMTTSYGDLGDILKKNHGSNFHGGTYGECIVNGDAKGVVIDTDDLHVTYEMTWNKAAKAIHRWVHEEAENSVPAVSSDAVLSEEYAKAVKLDLNIKTNAQAAQMSLYEVCKGLKEMRDGKLYKQLGYANFEEYTENEVGIKRIQAYKMIKTIESLPEDFVHSNKHFGITKLSLLATLEEEQRTEIVENIDVENTTVKELKAEIQQYRKEQHELMEKLDDTQKKYEKSEEYREELCDENDKMSLRISKLLAEVDELKDCPIDVTYSDADSHEVENMRKAMDKMDLEWSTKYAEEQERNIKEVQELNIKHTAELNQMKAEYEDKIRNTASESSIGKEKVKQKSDIYFDMLNSIMDDIEDFLFEINDSSLQARHIKRFINCVQEFIDRVDDDDEGE